MVAAVCENPQMAPISDKERALFDLLEKVNDAAHTVTLEDVQAAREAGLSDAEIFDGVTVCAASNFLNRWTSGTGVEAMPPGFWEGYLAEQGDLHYAADGAPPPPMADEEAGVEAPAPHGPPAGQPAAGP